MRLWESVPNRKDVYKLVECNNRYHITTDGEKFIVLNSIGFEVAITTNLEAARAVMTINETI
jgi:hypothetical protein